MCVSHVVSNMKIPKLREREGLKHSLKMEVHSCCGSFPSTLPLWSCFESVGMSEDLPGTSVQCGPNGWVVKLFRFLLFMGNAGKAVGLENAFFSQLWLTRVGLEWNRGYFSSFFPFGFVSCEQYGAFNSSWEPGRNSFANQPFKDSLKTWGKTNKQKNICQKRRSLAKKMIVRFKIGTCCVSCLDVMQEFNLIGDIADYINHHILGVAGTHINREQNVASFSPLTSKQSAPHKVVFWHRGAFGASIAK